MISASQHAWELIRSTLLAYLTHQRDQEEAQRLFLHKVDQTQQAGITATIENPRLSYRDIGLIQMAFALLTPGLDTTVRPPGARSVGGELGKFLSGLSAITTHEALPSRGFKKTL